MKLISMTVAFLFTFAVFANEQQLPLKLNVDGQPSFGIQYSYDEDFSWSFNYSTTISNQTLSTLPDAFYWNIQDEASGNLFAQWSKIDKRALMVGSIGLQDRAVLTSLLPNLKSVKIVYGSMNQLGVIEILFSVPVGPLCKSYPSHFVDLTNTSKKACEVVIQDITDSQPECRDLKDQLILYLNKNLLTCGVAKNHYAKKGCGNLNCH